jgi:hypothetical protein
VNLIKGDRKIHELKPIATSRDKDSSSRSESKSSSSSSSSSDEIEYWFVISVEALPPLRVAASTDDELNPINDLSRQGLSYKTIAAVLGLGSFVIVGVVLVVIKKTSFRTLATRNNYQSL